jgi:type I restriction enzyme, S subunit
VQSGDEWGILKTTAITWDVGWDEFAHKVPPEPYWGARALEVGAGDVLITKAGPRHRVAVVADVPATRPHLMVSGKMIGLRPVPEVVLPVILAGALATPGAQKYLDQRTTGMAESQVNFANETLLSTPLQLPPMEEQRSIAAILATLDTAVRTTRSAIEKLRQIEQGLLDTLTTRGLDVDGRVRDPEREPSDFCETALGPRPRSWDTTQVGTLLQQNPKNGYSPPDVDEWNGTWMLGLGCLTTFGFAPRQLKMAPADDPALNAALLSDGDLLMSRANTRETVGYVGRYRDVGAPCTYPDLMMRLTPTEAVSSDFLEITLRSAASRRQIQAVASGTSGSMVKINARTVKELCVVFPGADEQQRIVDVLAVQARRLKVEIALLAKLRRLRQGLRDGLLSGRVRVTTTLVAA